MRWYVSRNGQTTETPVDDAQVAAWIQQGMTEAMIRDEQGGQWMPLAQSPFRTLMPMHTRGVGHRILVGLGIGMVGLVLRHAGGRHRRWHHRILRDRRARCGVRQRQDRVKEIE